MEENLTEDPRDVSHPSLDPSLKSCQKLSQQKGGCRKPFLKKGNKEKRLSYTKLQKKRAENHSMY